MFEKPNPKYVIKLIRDPFHHFLHKHYFTIHFVILILLSLIDTMLMISAYLVPAAILWNMGSFINSLTHMNYGYRNYKTLDKSTNIPWLGYMMFGEGWHNNHHHNPNNPKFGLSDNELDLGYYIISKVRLPS